MKQKEIYPCEDVELEDLLRQLPEPKSPDYMYCPRCEDTRGRWWGFRRRKDGAVVRRRMCHWCKKIYPGAVYRNVHRKVGLAEAKCFLRNSKRFAEFVEFVEEMNGHGCTRG